MVAACVWRTTPRQKMPTMNTIATKDGTQIYFKDWNEDRSIVWKGKWQGKPFEDKGVILQFKPTIQPELKPTSAPT
jgi:hypothetical protein